MTVQWTQKYRPKSLSEYIGNETMKTQISSLVRYEKLPQAIMFYGEKGTGKTTIARLLVKNLMCDKPVLGEACGNCSKCNHLDNNYITTGKAPQNMLVKELNIADLRGVADAEEIVSDMKKKVSFNRKRVFILDEMQQASKEAQSAFLKIIEEPIPNLYVIMCTTHPDKITEALSSRFNRFRVRRPETKDIAERLQYICQLEGVNYDFNALKILASYHKNNPRESINKLETLAVTSENQVTVKEVEKQLEIISTDIFEKYLMTCKTGNFNNIINLLEKLENEGIDIKKFISGLGDFVVDLLKIRSGVKLDLYTVDKTKRMRKFIKKFTQADINLVLKVLKDYSSISTDMDFHIYALATELTEGMNIVESKKEVEETEAGKRYRQTTKQVIEQKAVNRELKLADSEYLESKLPAKKVVGIPTKKEG